MDVPIGLRCRSRSDFLRMLRQLGANPGVSYSRFDAETREIRDIQHVYLRCRYDQWLQAFGEPEAVSPGFDSAVGAYSSHLATPVRRWSGHVHWTFV